VKHEEFKPIIEEVLHETSSLITQKGITLTSKIDSFPPVLCDRAKLKEVLFNLVGNAAKYNKEKGKIHISAYELPGENKMMFEIQDTGFGIPKDQQEKIFQKFFRAVTDETHEIIGTGLGLFITRMLVEKMGGKLLFSSSEHQGTTFSFTLPLTR
jgi:two-component system, sensor histidine kinase ChiS